MIDCLARKRIHQLEVELAELKNSLTPKPVESAKVVDKPTETKTVEK